MDELEVLVTRIGYTFSLFHWRHRLKPVADPAIFKPGVRKLDGVDFQDDILGNISNRPPRMTDPIALEAHFPDFDRMEPANILSPFAFISVFDHWLSEEEAGASGIMTYSLASETGEMDWYLEGERNFLELYRRLGTSGAIINQPSPCRRIDTASDEFEAILLDSLREKRLMDIYFEGHGVRIMGGWDRTDMVIADSAEQFAALHTTVQEFRLFLLS